MSTRRTFTPVFILLLLLLAGCQKKTQPTASQNKLKAQARKLTVAKAAKPLPTVTVAQVPDALAIQVPAGSFWMGSSSKDKFRFINENPKHKVLLTRKLLAWQTEVTQAQYKAVMGTNPARYKKCGSNCPVERVSWNDAALFANALSQKHKLPACFVCKDKKCSLAPQFKGKNYHTCKGWRLPSEAEWEYLAWSGQSHPKKDKFPGVMWDGKRNLKPQTHPVRKKPATPWGLYGMLGNVFEWTLDNKFRKYTKDNTTNPIQSGGSVLRVVRGGCWFLLMWKPRVTCREWMLPHTRSHLIGFRPVRSL